MLVRENHGFSGPDTVHGRPEDAPVQTNTRSSRKSVEEIADAGSVADDDELVSIEKPDPPESSEGSPNAIFFRSRRGGDFWPIHEGHGAVLQPGLEDGDVIVGAEIVIEEEVANTSGLVILEPFRKVAGFIAKAHADRDALRGVRRSARATDVARETAEVGAIEALGKIDSLVDRGMKAQFFPNLEIQSHLHLQRFDFINPTLRTDKTCVEAAGQYRVGGSLDDGAAVGEQGKCVIAAAETQQKIVALYVAMGSEALFHLGEIDRTEAFMDLDGVAAAERDMGAAFSAKMGEVSVAADGAVFASHGRRDFGPLIGPEVAGEERCAHLVVGADDPLESFGDLNRGREVDCGIEDSGSVAGFDDAGGWVGKDAGEAGRFAGEDVHGHSVGADGGGIDPGFGLLDGVVIDEVAGFEVIGGVEDDVRFAQELMNIGGNEVGDVGADLDFAVEGGDFAAGGFGFGESFAGVGLIEQDLALQIAFFDEVAVDEG
jgi:hypothetical protein